MIVVGAMTLLVLAVQAAPAPQPEPQAQPQPEPATAFVHAERLGDLAGLKNVGRIAPGIYRGSAPSTEGLRTLKELGIKTVINLRHYHGDSERHDCAELGLDYVRIPLESSDPPQDDAVERFLRIVTDPERQPVYFHCWRGKDRTGVMAALYRIKIEGWPLDAALAEMDAFGFFKGWGDLRSYVVQAAGEPDPDPEPVQ